MVAGIAECPYFHLQGRRTRNDVRNLRALPDSLTDTTPPTRPDLVILINISQTVPLMETKYSNSGAY